MISSISIFDQRQIIQLEPNIGSTINELRQYIHAYSLTTGAILSSVLDAKYHNNPLLIISSKRIDDNWPIFEGGGNLMLDGCRTGYDTVEYLAWNGKDFGLAIEGPSIYYEIDNYGARQQLLILWVTETLLVLDWVNMDEDLQDTFYAASRIRHLPRFVPDEEYVAAKMSKFPALLAEDEERFLGESGEPIYVIYDLEVLKSEVG